MQKKTIATKGGAQKKKKGKSRQNVHDAFFRKFFREKIFAVDLFRYALPPEQFGLFAWESLRTEETACFDHLGNEKRADLVFSVKLKKNRKPANLVILLEHKSYNDARLMQQVLEYQVALYAKYGRPVIPIVVQQGSKKNKKSLRFQDSLKEMTPTLRKYFGGAVLDFVCYPVDIHAIDWNDGNLTAGPIFYIMSKIRRMGLRGFWEFIRLCKKIGNKRMLERLLKEGSAYLNRYNPEKYSWKNQERVYNEVLDEGEKIMKRMTFGEEMAKEEGREHERKENALRMLAKNESIAKICEYTNLTAEEVKELRNEKKAA